MKLLFALVTVAAFSVAFSQVFIQCASNAAGLNGIVNRFRRCLGDPNNGNAQGNQGKGRREINWDADIVPFDMPFDFFNTGITTRGAAFKTKGGEFRVSNDPRTGDDRFDSIISKSQAAQFKFFSPSRLFSPLRSNRMNVAFRISARKKRACVNGFGVIFADVDVARKTKIVFFDKRNKSFRTLFSPTRDRGLCFVGLCGVQICKAKITTGTISLQSFGKKGVESKKRDVVVMDDFLYGEPM